MKKYKISITHVTTALEKQSRFAKPKEVEYEEVVYTQLGWANKINEIVAAANTVLQEIDDMDDSTPESSQDEILLPPGWALTRESCDCPQSYSAILPYPTGDKSSTSSSNDGRVTSDSSSVCESCSNVVNKIVPGTDSGCGIS